MLKVIWNISGALGLRRLVENYFLKRLTEAFGKSEPLSTSFDDAYPVANGIEDFPPREAKKEILAELSRSSAVFLSAGVYDFYLEGFCLRAGAYSPVKGDGYLMATLKGTQAGIISDILRDSPKHPDISQQAVQMLLWAVESGARYTSMKGAARSAADVILSEEHKNLLGRSFWDVIPPVIQNLITDELFLRMPVSVKGLILTYRNVKNRIEAGAAYSEVERFAVLFNPPAVSSVPTIKSGTWCSMPGGYCVRAFPSGYTAARLQVFVPPSAEKVKFSFGDFILVPADTTRQRLGLRALPGRDENDGRPPETKDDIEIVFKEGERMSNPDVIAALKKLAELLGADRVRVSDGDRTFEEYRKLKGNDKTYEDYLKNRHGEGQGYIAADCQFSKNGNPKLHSEAADAAASIEEIGGIGLYDGHIHIDLRPRLPGDIPTRWDERGSK